MEAGEEWADVRLHRGRRPCGPRGTSKARVTKEASALQSSLLKPLWESCFAVPLLSGASHFLSGQLRNVPPGNQHTHGECLHPRWLVIIVMADVENVAQLSKLACNINTRGI